MDLPFDMAAARLNLNRASLLRKKQLHERYAQACADFSKILAVIVEKYSPRRIYQWGSLLDESSFTEVSDIDIAVEGVTDAASFFALYGDAMRCTGFSLDIVQIEKIEPEFAEIIRSKGRVVYEKQ
jgi:predicted nucleotidyltransferase